MLIDPHRSLTVDLNFCPARFQLFCPANVSIFSSLTKQFQCDQIEQFQTKRYKKNFVIFCQTKDFVPQNCYANYNMITFIRLYFVSYLVTL